MRALAWTVLALIAGCASVPRDAGFDDVTREARARGALEVSWRHGTMDPETAHRLDVLLSEELTAGKAVQVSLLASPRLQAVYEELSLAQAEVVQAGLPRNPSLGVSLRLPVEGAGVGPELAVAQGVVDLLQIPLRKRLAGAAFEAAKLRVTGEILDVATETRAAFYALQAASQLREMRSSVLDALSASYELRKRLHAAGNVTDYDLGQERATFEQSKLDLATAETVLEVARTRLDAVMGTSGARTAWRFEERLAALPPVEIDLSRVEARAIDRSLELGVLRQDLVAAGGALGLARTYAFLPSLLLGGTAERELDGAWSAGASASIPIPIFDQGQARVATAEAQLRRLRELQASVAVEVRAAAREGRARLGLARRRVEFVGGVLLPLRRHVVEQAQLQYNAMQIGAFQLIAARRAEIETGARWIAELEGYWTTRADLERLLNGRLGRGMRERNSATASASASPEEPTEGAH